MTTHDVLAHLQAQSQHMADTQRTYGFPHEFQVRWVGYEQALLDAEDWVEHNPERSAQALLAYLQGCWAIEACDQDAERNKARWAGYYQAILDAQTLLP